jgi:hypothetical protein
MNENNLVLYDDRISGEAVIDGKNRNIDPFDKKQKSSSKKMRNNQNS